MSIVIVKNEEFLCLQDSNLTSRKKSRLVKYLKSKLPFVSSMSSVDDCSATLKKKIIKEKLFNENGQALNFKCWRLP